MKRLRFEECAKCSDYDGSVVNCFNICGKSLDALEEYNRLKDLEEQGLMKIFPCKVGDTVYFISEKVEKQGRRKVLTEFVDRGIVDNITLGSTMIPQITVCNDENIWITFDGVDDFGNTVFLTQDKAEEALKKVGKND